MEGRQDKAALIDYDVLVIGGGAAGAGRRRGRHRSAGRAGRLRAAGLHDVRLA